MLESLPIAFNNTVISAHRNAIVGKEDLAENLIMILFHGSKALS
ncbi:hypothetical protein A2U01_0074280, partial [Trifolium medium]|nr:hypothetical protein [Trifolium medium]